MAGARQHPVVPPDRTDIPLTGGGPEEALDAETPIEPGDPSPENVLFVLLGVLVALAVIARLFVLFG